MAKKNVLIEVDGETKLMKLGFNGLIEIEETLGRPLSEFGDGDIKFADLRTIFYIALKHGGDAKVTLEQTGDYLDSVLEEKGMDYLTEKLTELFNSLMGSKEAQAPFLSTVQ